MTIKALAEEVHIRLRSAVKYDSEDDHIRALDCIEDARKSMQELYLEVWRKYHISGTGGGKRNVG